MSIKKYSDFITEMRREYKPILSLELIEPGTAVTYSGAKYYVIDSNEFTLELSKNKEALPGDRKNFLVNKNMFHEVGGIFPYEDR
jgi:hypothetical protein